MPTYVLGTHTSHSGSACLLKDGEIVVAIEKERITRIKHDGGNDNAAIHYCLKAAGITLKDVDLVVQNANYDMFERKNARSRASGRIVESARRVVSISHHLAHAYSAIGTAPFSDTSVLVIDGCGNCYADCIDKEGTQIPERPPTADLEQLYFEKDSYYAWRDGVRRDVFKDFSPFGRAQGYPMFPNTTMHSIGGAYFGVSQYVFRGVEDPGKLMGLAPYGRPGVIPHEMFSLRDGRVFMNYDWTREFDRPALDAQDFKRNFQYYADIAWWAQREIERALLYVVRSRYEMHPCDNLAYCGGVALNAVANRLIRTQTKFKNLYIQPAAGDSGLAIGCAFYGWLQVLGQKRTLHRRGSNFGKVYGPEEIRASLQRHQSRIGFARHPDIVEVTAELLAQNKIIAWFQGSSEFGPRALGQRSILALPVNEGTRDFINSKIKFREDFRPFAPAVPVEDVSTYFEQDYDSPYMILVALVRPEWRDRIPAVVHRDGSARIQTVHREITPRFHRLHQAIGQRTGLPILLNTSLNRRGAPIVETPDEAIVLFLETALDALVIDDWLILKKSTSQADASGETQLDLAALFQAMCRPAPAESTDQPAIGAWQVVVTGLDETWTVDFSGKPQARKGTSHSVDHTLVVTREALSEILRDPTSVERLFQMGHLRIPGIGNRDPNVVGAALNRIRLMFARAASADDR